MMVNPSKEENKMFKVLDPWIILVDDTFVLKENAPKEAKDMYEIYKQKYGNKI